MNRKKTARKNRYIALEQLNFIWDEPDVLVADEMWRIGVPIDYISQSFGRDPDELVVLVLDRCRKGFIEPRPGALWGRGSQ